MTPQSVRVGAGLLTVVLGGMASWLLLALLRSFGPGYPLFSWVGLVPLLAVTALVLVMAWQIRRYTRGRARSRPSPQRARGTLVGAQAAALGGAALVGWYVANALVHVANADVPSERHQLIWALVHAAAALLLSVSGYLGQAWCRIPPTEHDDDSTASDGDLAYG